jgi:hypothetical protein
MVWSLNLVDSRRRLPPFRVNKGGDLGYVRVSVTPSVTEISSSEVLIHISKAGSDFYSELTSILYLIRHTAYLPS